MPNRLRVDGRGWMISTAEGRDTIVAEMMEARWPSDLKQITQRQIRMRILSHHPHPVCCGKQAVHFLQVRRRGFLTDGNDPMKIATAAVDSTKARSYELILSDHTKAWQELWNTDIEIEGNPELQKVVHACMFYLLSSLDKDTDFSIPPMALSSQVTTVTSSGMRIPGCFLHSR